MDEWVIWAVGAAGLAVVLPVCRWLLRRFPRDRFVEGRVTRVSDGDGLEIRFPFRGTHRVRLAYVDAPELNQPWGTEARGALERLVGGIGRQVAVRVLRRDHYGRLIAEVQSNSVDVNAALVEQGTLGRT